jgi:hypothetical protein
MSKAFSNFDTREIARRQYQLLADFRYDDVLGFGVITAKNGFITDYASIDVLKNVLLFLFYALLVGYGDKAATIHDWIYRGYGITRVDGTVYYPTRKECDQIFYRALRAEGVAKWRSAFFYAGVRIGGRSSYKRVTAKAA